MTLEKNIIKGRDHNTFLPNGMRAMMEASVIGVEKRGGAEVVKKARVYEWLAKGGWTISIAEDEVDVEKELLIVHDKVQDASEKYKRATNGLKSAMQNDVASIAASAHKAIAELSKLQISFSTLIALMDGEGMKQAIVNAERLAVALQSLSSVQENNITFAVQSKGQTVDERK